MPVEAPINSSFTAKRFRQPTIGVPADEKAAFLNEMKACDSEGFSMRLQIWVDRCPGWNP